MRRFFAVLLLLWLCAAPLHAVDDDDVPVHEDAAALETELAHESAATALRLLRDKGIISDEEYRQALVDAQRRRSTGHVEIQLAPGQGFTLTTPDHRFSMNWRARVQMRATLQAGTRVLPRPDPGELYAEEQRLERETSLDAQVRTVRLIVGGHVVTKDIRYRLQLAFGANDFDPQNPSPIFDTWMEFARFRDFRVRFGQYFVPFDRARTVRESSLLLVDRQQAVSELNLARDVGIMVHSEDLLGFGGRLVYHLFAGMGGGRNRFKPQRPGLLLAARFSVRPFGAFDDDQVGDLERSTRPRLAIGAAVAFNHRAQRQRGTFGGAYQLEGFNYFHGCLDVVLKFAGFFFLGEMLMRKATLDVRTGDVEGKPVTEYSRSGAGFVLEGGYTLTERLIIGVRYDRLVALGKTDPQLVQRARVSGHELGAGLNVLLNGHDLKFQWDYQLQLGDDVVRDGMHHLSRVQFEGTF